MNRRVIYGPRVQGDLLNLYRYIAEAASPSIAAAYLERLDRHLKGYDLFGERGSRRDDIRPKLRIVGFERRTAVLFEVSDEEVIFLRILYGGQDLDAALGD